MEDIRGTAWSQQDSKQGWPTALHATLEERLREIVPTM